MKTRTLSKLSIPLALLLVVGGAGCGDDSGDAKRPRPRPSSGAGPKGPGGGGGGGGNLDKLSQYTKVEDVVADPEEARALRHEFEPEDFVPGSTGQNNRNPFRSYVVFQPGIGSAEEEMGTIQPTEICKPKNMVASNYSLRDLRLVGIVLRGTRSYALFRDNASFGHIVKRGDCVGKEKALVKKIGSGFIQLEILPEPSPNAPPQPPTKREIQLYPEELELQEEEEIPETAEEGE